MRHAGPTRREIGVRTAFNLLGPLTNPAGATRGLIGVGDAAIAPKVAEVLLRLGTERSFVVCGAGVDELPLDGTGVIYDVTPAGIERREVDPEAVGLRRAKTSSLGGADPAANAALVEGVLRGEPGARRDVVLLNAGAALVAAGDVASDRGRRGPGGPRRGRGARGGAAREAARGAARGRGGGARTAARGRGRATGGRA